MTVEALHDVDEPIDFRPAFELPGEVSVLGQRFHISVLEHPTAALDPASPESYMALGYCDRSLQTITIRGASALSEDKARETLLHEVLHAIVGTARIEPVDGDHGEEETWVSQLAPLLLLTLRDNPLLVAALISR